MRCTSRRLTLLAPAYAAVPHVDASALPDESRLLAELRARRAPCVVTNLGWAHALTREYPSPAEFLRRWGDTPAPRREEQQVEQSGGAFLTSRQAVPVSSLATSASGGGGGSLSFSTTDEDELGRRLAGALHPPAALAGCAAAPIVSVGGARAGLGFHRHEESWLVLVTGEKTWWIGEPHFDLPRLRALGVPGDDDSPAAPSAAAYASEGVVWRHVQLPGTLVYVPAGYWHGERNGPPRSTDTVPPPN
jgi:hypothetical protein